METYITSDLHIGHTNIIKYCPESRPFSCIEEMNEKIVSNWNSVVKKLDRVFILGDVGFGMAKDITNILRRLNGDKILIIGNHDHKNIKSKDFYNEFNYVVPYHVEHVNKKMVVMFHFPIEYWDQRHRGSFHLHGHLHSKNPDKLTQRRYDVGLDGNECKVYNMVELLEYIENKVPFEKGNSHHA